jgi:ammonium transporter
LSAPALPVATAQEPPAEPDPARVKLVAETNTSDIKADSAWMLVSTALVMLMVPGLALFYGGMVRRKNILGTMMHSMVALAIVGVYWVAIGYSLAFGAPWLSPFGEEKGSVLGFSDKLIFLKGIEPWDKLPFTNIPIFLHMLFQGMFAIITPALISGAVAERIRFGPYLLFLLLWVTFVYCPLAHCVWALAWWTGLESAGQTGVGYLAKMGAWDFAGGTVVHIAAGFSSLAAILVLRRRIGYPEQTIHPSSMVLTLTGAGLLWFGWFGFNGGSALASGALATSAFAATQCAAAGAGLTWMLAEWLHRGKPTALGLASGIVAGLVAVTPASGYVYPWGGLAIGLISGVVCYVAVVLKSGFKYDDSLDAFGVHGVGGFLGAVLTGVFCYTWKFIDAKVDVGADGLIASGKMDQVIIQLKAAAISAAVAFVFSLVLVKVIDLVLGFVSNEEDETVGLDRTEHGETGFDFGLAMETASVGASAEPRPAKVPPGGKRFHVVLEGVKDTGELARTWSDMCQPGTRPPEFKAVFPNVTTVQGNRFTFRGGDQDVMRDNLQRLLQDRLKTPVKARVESA